MKKLMMALAVCALTGAVQAAITYEMTNGYGGGTLDTSYYSLYARAAVDTAFGSTRDAIEKYFTDAVADGTWADAKAAWQSEAWTTDVRTEAAHVFQEKTITSGPALTFDRASSEEQYNYWAVVFYQNGDTEAFRVIEAVNPKGTATIITEGATIAERTGTWGEWKTVPEPTSGLLLLLGVAGLCLRRKQK